MVPESEAKEGLSVTESERAQRDRVLAAVKEAIRAGRTIRLPDFDRARPASGDRYALLSVGIEPNPFGGSVGAYRYQFEGEEDLLHLVVVRHDRNPIEPAEGRQVAEFLLPGVPPGLIWIKPGELSQHFFVGHDELIRDEGSA